jgi:hypothetical protein
MLGVPGIGPICRWCVSLSSSMTLIWNGGAMGDVCFITYMSMPRVSAGHAVQLLPSIGRKGIQNSQRHCRTPQPHARKTLPVPLVESNAPAPSDYT